MTGVAQLAGAGTLLLSIALLCARRVDTAVAVCAAQALLAAIALAMQGWGPAAAAGLAFACNGVAIPLALQRLPSRSAMPAGIALPSGAAVASWLAALVVLLATVAIFTRVASDDAMIPGASVVLLGLLMVAQRSHPLIPVLGLLSAQNGCLLVAGAIADLPESALLVVGLPLVPAMLVADRWLRA